MPDKAMERVSCGLGGPLFVKGMIFFPPVNLNPNSFRKWQVAGWFLVVVSLPLPFPFLRASSAPCWPRAWSIFAKQNRSDYR